MTHIFYSLRDSPNFSENKSFKSLVFFFDTHIITQVINNWQVVFLDKDCHINTESTTGGATSSNNCF